MVKNRFMRIIVLFDLPTLTKTDLRVYRNFVKFLEAEGYIRMQFSVYNKLCINVDSANTNIKRLRQNKPSKGDVRYMLITENQYQRIEDLNNKKSLQENMTTIDRTLMIGGMNDESDT